MEACAFPAAATCCCRCVNLEAQIISRLPSAISNPADAAKALAVAQYYLYDASASSTGSGSSDQSGGGVEAVLLAAFDFDVAALLQRINSTRQELLQVRLQLWRGWTVA
jgi:hypothetical protein